MDRVKKLITEPGNPNLIISAAEDSSGLAPLPPLSSQHASSSNGWSRGLPLIEAGLYMPCCTISGCLMGGLSLVLAGGLGPA